MFILHQKYLKLFFSSVFALFFLAKCTSNNRLDIDVPKPYAGLEFKRMDRQIFSVEKTEFDMVKRHFQLLDEYPQTYQLFVESMLREGFAYDTLTAKKMLLFVSDKDMGIIYKAIDDKFPDTEFFKEEFSQAFGYYAHYFPNEYIPNIIGYFSNFNAKSMFLDSSIAIGLELYLGTTHPVIERLSTTSLPNYLKQKMNADYLVSDALKFFLLTRYYHDMGDDFLSIIVSMGKILYVLDALQPKVEDWKKMGYTAKQLQWCEDNEDQIWKYTVDNQLLFSTNFEKISHFIDEGPFTKGLPEESPSMVGIWMGWQMVRDYMQENTTVTLQELISEKDAKKILKFYQPN